MMRMHVTHELKQLYYMPPLADDHDLAGSQTWGSRRPRRRYMMGFLIWLVVLHDRSRCGGGANAIQSLIRPAD